MTSLVMGWDPTCLIVTMIHYIKLYCLDLGLGSGLVRGSTSWFLQLFVDFRITLIFIFILTFFIRNFCPRPMKMPPKCHYFAPEDFLIIINLNWCYITNFISSLWLFDGPKRVFQSSKPSIFQKKTTMKKVWYFLIWKSQRRNWKRYPEQTPSPNSRSTEWFLSFDFSNHLIDLAYLIRIIHFLRFSS